MILTEEQRSIRDSVKSWAEDVVLPGAADRDRNAQFPHDELGEAATLGLCGMIVPEQWQGAGADMLSLALSLEEIAVVDGALSTILSVNNSVVCGPLLSFGSDSLKQKWLPEVASGRKLGCFCLTEPEAGSDASAIRTRAVESSEGYLLNGTKQFITSGKNADVAIVFAVTDPEAGKKGISAFVVDTQNPGYKVARVEDKLGQRASDTAQIVFENCMVAADHMLGGKRRRLSHCSCQPGVGANRYRRTMRWNGQRCVRIRHAVCLRNGRVLARR